MPWEPRRQSVGCHSRTPHHLPRRREDSASHRSARMSVRSSQTPPRCASAGPQLSRLWSVHTEEGHPGLKWLYVNLQRVMLSKKSQSQRSHPMYFHLCGIYDDKFQKWREGCRCQVLRVVGGESLWQKGPHVSTVLHPYPGCEVVLWFSKMLPLGEPSTGACALCGPALTAAARESAAASKQESNTSYFLILDLTAY